MVIIKMDGFADSSYETEMGIRYFVPHLTYK